jgi:hypothetical protein
VRVRCPPLSRCRSDTPSARASLMQHRDAGRHVPWPMYAANPARDPRRTGRLSPCGCRQITVTCTRSAPSGRATPASATTSLPCSPVSTVCRFPPTSGCGRRGRSYRWLCDRRGDVRANENNPPTPGSWWGVVPRTKACVGPSMCTVPGDAPGGSLAGTCVDTAAGRSAMSQQGPWDCSMSAIRHLAATVTRA